MAGSRGEEIWRRMLPFCGGEHNHLGVVFLCRFNLFCNTSHILLSFLIVNCCVARQLPVPVIAVIHGMCFGGGTNANRLP